MPPARRSLTYDMCQAHLNHRIQTSHDAFAENPPNFKLLRKRCNINRADWKRYLSGFEHIRRQAQDCASDEFEFYLSRLSTHIAEAKQFYVKVV